ncbi:MAG: PH domain-containing protein [Candidatus Kapabacteria bacterium]|nr:PH domain-containing protein [Ignavibacteriota bacterium]MCW5885910.1 PH domain-containing protein [Candidatus Kapabacteria bacterium]
MYSLDPAIKIIWGVVIFIQFMFYSAVAIFLEFFVIPGNLSDWIIPKGMIALGFFSLGLILTFIIPVLRFKYWKFEVRDEEIYLERGILTRIKTVAPYRRIQHTDVQQSILERMSHLGKLVIYTAGTRGADVILPGLPIEYAEDLRDKLRNITIEDAV